jgi:hypothetical protein
MKTNLHSRPRLRVNVSREELHESAGLDRRRAALC